MVVSGSSAGVGEVGSSPSDWESEDMLAACSCQLYVIDIVLSVLQGGIRGIIPS